MKLKNKNALLLLVAGLFLLLSCSLAEKIGGADPIAPPTPSGNQPKNSSDASPPDTQPGSDEYDSGYSEMAIEELLYSDDFSDPESGWDRASWDEGLTDYLDGVYQMAAYKDGFDIWANPGRYYADLQVQVTATKVGGGSNDNFGLICRYSGSPSEPGYYSFQITSAGYAAIVKFTDGEGLYLTEIKADDAVLPGYETNVLLATCLGDELRLYVNGEPVAAARDSDFSSGDVGLIVGTFGDAYNEITFDDFSVIGY